MAGREIKPSKGNESYDAGRRHVFAEKIQPLPENLKKKISIIQEAIPTRSKTEIAEILQSCDYDVDRTLNCFIAVDSEMDVQNEWMVQRKRKNKKKKKSGKKVSEDNGNKQATEVSQTDVKNDQATSVQEHKKSEKAVPCDPQNHKPRNLNLTSNGELPPENKVSEKNIAVTNKKTVKQEVTASPPKSLANGDLKVNGTNVSETVSPSPLSPSESVKSPDSQSFGKSKAVHATSEKHTRVRTTSTSGPEVIRKSLKDLQRSSVSIARFQSMLDDQAESSTKVLAKSFQVLRQILDEREKLLEQQLKTVISETKSLLDGRQENAAVLKFKCNRVGTMTESETVELRNEIKHFVGERRIDEDLGKTIRFLRDEEKMIEAIKSFGDVIPVKHHYTPYKRRHPDPVEVKSDPSKAAPRKTSIPASNGTLPSSDADVASKNESTNQVKASSSGSDKHPVLSPSRLKDQAEIHARLQKAVKQQVGSIEKDNKLENRADADKPKHFGGNTSKFPGGKQPRSEPRRQRAPPQQRRENFENSTQNSSKSPGKRGEGNGANENKKTQGEKSEGSVAPLDNTREGKKENGFEESKERTNSTLANSYPGNRRTKRRYVRKTPPEKVNGDQKYFTPANAEDKKSQDENRAREAADKKESTEKNHLKVPQDDQDSVGNGINGVAPLPQRNPGKRKKYYRKNPGTQVKFPPTRENDSLSSAPSRQSSAA